MLNIVDTQRATVWKIEDKGNYTLVQMSTSRKDKKSNTYKNSNWSFVRFVGEAHKKANLLERKSRIVLKGAGLSKEPYTDKDGKEVYPENPQFVVFNWEFQEQGSPSQHTSSEAVPEDEEIPDFLR